MKVFNLTQQVLHYKGRPVPPNGGFVEIPNLTFIPDRDRKLEADRVLSFGKLPEWFLIEQQIRTANEAKKAVEPVKKANAVEVLPPPPKVEDKVEEAKKYDLPAKKERRS